MIPINQLLARMGEQPRQPNPGPNSPWYGLNQPDSQGGSTAYLQQLAAQQGTPSPAPQLTPSPAPQLTPPPPSSPPTLLADPRSLLPSPGQTGGYSTEHDHAAVPFIATSAAVPSVAAAGTTGNQSYQDMLRASFTPQFNQLDAAINALKGIYNTTVGNTKSRFGSNEQNITGVYGSLMKDLGLNNVGTLHEVAGNQRAVGNAFDALDHGLASTYGNVQGHTGDELHRLGLSGAANGADTSHSDLAFLQGLAGADRAGATHSMQAAQSGFSDLMNGNQSAAGMDQARAHTSNQQHLQDNLVSLANTYFQQSEPLLQQKAQLQGQMAQTLRSYLFPDPLTQAEINWHNGQGAFNWARAGALSGQNGGPAGGINFDALSGPAGAQTFLAQQEHDPNTLKALEGIVQQAQAGQPIGGVGGLSPELKNTREIQNNAAAALKALGYGDGTVSGSAQNQELMNALTILLKSGGNSGGAYKYAFGDPSAPAQ